MFFGAKRELINEFLPYVPTDFGGKLCLVSVENYFLETEMRYESFSLFLIVTPEIGANKLISSKVYLLPT